MLAISPSYASDEFPQKTITLRYEAEQIPLLKVACNLHISQLLQEKTSDAPAQPLQTNEIQMDGLENLKRKDSFMDMSHFAA